MTVMVEEFPLARNWAFPGFIFLSFFITAHFPLPLQPGSGPQPQAHKRLVVCQAVSMGGCTLRAEAGAGEEAVTGPPAQGLNQ